VKGGQLAIVDQLFFFFLSSFTPHLQSKVIITEFMRASENMMSQVGPPGLREHARVNPPSYTIIKTNKSVFFSHTTNFSMI